MTMLDDVRGLGLLDPDSPEVPEHTPHPVRPVIAASTRSGQPVALELAAGRS
jgi:hypothetical protein